jgi:hypothetical protein
MRGGQQVPAGYAYPQQQQQQQMAAQQQRSQQMQQVHCESPSSALMPQSGCIIMYLREAESGSGLSFAVQAGAAAADGDRRGGDTAETSPAAEVRGLWPYHHYTPRARQPLFTPLGPHPTPRPHPHLMLTYTILCSHTPVPLPG